MVKGRKLELMRIELEVRPLSQWLYSARHQAGLPVEAVGDTARAQRTQDDPVKTNRNDAR